MRLLPLLAALAVTACTAAEAEDPTGTEWELMAIDGKVVDIPATLKLGPDGSVSGKAPCNSYAGQNLVTFPQLSLGALRATRMACDRLADEQRYFDTLSAMTAVEQIGARNLVLTGPDGRSMEFADDLKSTLTRCLTCTPKD